MAWVLVAKPLDHLPNVARWRQVMKRPAVRRGVDLLEELCQSKPPTADERRIPFNPTTERLRYRS